MELLVLVHVQRFLPTQYEITQYELLYEIYSYKSAQNTCISYLKSKYRIKSLSDSASNVRLQFNSFQFNY